MKPERVTFKTGIFVVERPAFPIGPLFYGDGIKHYIYVITSDDLIKVGITNNVKNRVRSIGHQMPYPVELYAFDHMPAYLAEWTERSVHFDLKDHQHKGEWFTCDPEPAFEIVKYWANIARRHHRQKNGRVRL